MITNYLKTAKELPSHTNGVLNPVFTASTDSGQTTVLYSDDCSPAAVFEAAKIRSSGPERFYVRTEPTYRPDGTLKPRREWVKHLYFHKKWARKDQLVRSAQFDVVGLKRQTTNLPAGVVVANIQFHL